MLNYLDERGSVEVDKSLVAVCQRAVEQCNPPSLSIVHVAVRGEEHHELLSRLHASWDSSGGPRADRDAEQAYDGERECLLHTNWITMEAAAGCVPPASGVIVSAGVFPLGLRSSIVEFATVVVTSASPEI